MPPQHLQTSQYAPLAVNTDAPPSSELIQRLIKSPDQLCPSQTGKWTSSSVRLTRRARSWCRLSVSRHESHHAGLACVYCGSAKDARLQQIHQPVSACKMLVATLADRALSSIESILAPLPADGPAEHRCTDSSMSPSPLHMDDLGDMTSSLQSPFSCDLYTNHNNYISVNAIDLHSNSTHKLSTLGPYAPSC